MMTSRHLHDMRTIASVRLVIKLTTIFEKVFKNRPATTESSYKPVQSGNGLIHPRQPRLRHLQIAYDWEDLDLYSNVLYVSVP